MIFTILYCIGAIFTGWYSHKRRIKLIQTGIHWRSMINNNELIEIVVADAILWPRTILLILGNSSNY